MGDLHVREDNAETYRELFGEISREADVLVLAGDLTDLGKPKEAELLAQDLKAWYRQLCKRPCFHDEYLQAFNEPGTRLIDTDGKGVERITETGVVVRPPEATSAMMPTAAPTATPRASRHVREGECGCRVNFVVIMRSARTKTTSETVSTSIWVMARSGAPCRTKSTATP